MPTMEPVAVSLVASGASKVWAIPKSRSVADSNGSVHPGVVDVMQELGMDLSDRRPQRLTVELAQEADVVVTMGCGDVCPVLPGKSYVDWGLEDPAGKPIERVREIRDEIERRVAELAGQLDPARQASA